MSQIAVSIAEIAQLAYCTCAPPESVQYSTCQMRSLASASRFLSFGPTLLTCTATAAESECCVMPWPFRPVSVSTSTKHAEAAFCLLTPSQEKSLSTRSGVA